MKEINMLKIHRDILYDKDADKLKKAYEESQKSRTKTTSNQYRDKDTELFKQAFSEDSKRQK